MIRRDTLLRWGCAGALALVLTGCASNAEHMTPASAHQPWMPRGDEETALWSLAAPRPAPPVDGAADFGIPARPMRAVLPDEAEIDPTRIYRLPELIDLAQRTNPATRATWQQARQAALAVGMVEATFLPILTASVIGGQQEL
ncbi:MAG TPA: TolC family protein, partial [bacterium]|nr:TolC family protein [bacterium]